jgi:hypothetical protein
MEKVRHRRGVLTTEQIYSDLKKTKQFIDSSKEPVRSWHLVSNKEKGTIGFMSGPMVRILTSNNVLKSSVKDGYTWNSKIPVTYVLATKIKKEWETYKETLEKTSVKEYKFKELPVAPCVAHENEPEVAKVSVVRKRKTKKEGWLKRFFKWIW